MWVHISGVFRGNDRANPFALEILNSIACKSNDHFTSELLVLFHRDIIKEIVNDICLY